MTIDEHEFVHFSEPDKIAPGVFISAGTTSGIPVVSVRVYGQSVELTIGQAAQMINALAGAMVEIAYETEPGA